MAGITAAWKQHSNHIFFLTTAKEVPASELLNAVMEDIISGMSAPNNLFLEGAVKMRRFCDLQHLYNDIDSYNRIQ